MSGNIFYLDDNQQAVAMREVKYDSEDIFQLLIEKYPDILAGDQINPENPRKWIFISREMGVPGYEGGSDQWFLDHLFIDQDAIPTFVEVKRSTDTRIRREVVAQMLDYAANATVYWKVEELKAKYEMHCQENGVEPLECINVPLDEADSFWNKVHDNLRLGKIRLLFVADEIPDSLRRIIEFLNGQMVDTEVLGVEIRQFISNKNHKILVPKVMGKTTASVQVKKAVGNQWTEEAFLESAKNIGGETAADICARLVNEFKRMGCRIYWGTGKSGSFVPIYEGKNRNQLMAVAAESIVRGYIYLQHFKAPFDSEQKQIELIHKFNQIPGFDISEDRVYRRPSFDCRLLAYETSFSAFIKIYEDMIKEIKNFDKGI